MSFEFRGFILPGKPLYWIALIVVIIGLPFASQNQTAVTYVSKKWYEGGNLHKATIAQWKTAAEENKLATSADWLASSLWKNHLKSPKDFDRMKAKAYMLVREIDIAVTAPQTDHMQITDITAALLIMSKDFAP